jgi:hypothetical protein
MGIRHLVLHLVLARGIERGILHLVLHLVLASGIERGILHLVLHLVLALGIMERIVCWPLARVKKERATRYKRVGLTRAILQKDPRDSQRVSLTRADLKAGVHNNMHGNPN